MKNNLTWFDRMMVAISFAEADVDSPVFTETGKGVETGHTRSKETAKRRTSGIVAAHT